MYMHRGVCRSNGRGVRIPGPTEAVSGPQPFNMNKNLGYHTALDICLFGSFACAKRKSGASFFLGVATSHTAVHG